MAGPDSPRIVRTIHKGYGDRQLAMPYLLVRHDVKDYATWKKAFDGHAATRKRSGSKGAHVYKSSHKPNEVVMLFEWDSAKNAHAFAESDDLKKTMEKAGVVGMPDIFFLEEIERQPA
jgi:quinol monooxygenase YgiN